MSKMITHATFDGKLQIRKGNKVEIPRGIVNSPTSIRATVVRNLTTGTTETSDINNSLMTQSAEDLNPILKGRIHGEIISTSGKTVFKILEGDVRRKDFSESTKINELTDSDNKCRICREKLKPGGFDFDHKDRDPSNNKPENCQVLCKTCHGIKTEEDRKKGNT